MMHKVSTAFLMRKLRKKSSERGGIAPVINRVVHRFADVIPSRANGEGRYKSCLITKSRLRARTVQ
jgi:hypothetical protein